MIGNRILISPKCCIAMACKHNYGVFPYILACVQKNNQDTVVHMPIAILNSVTNIV